MKIKSAIKNLSTEKTPSLDGFTRKLYQVYIKHLREKGLILKKLFLRIEKRLAKQRNPTVTLWEKKIHRPFYSGYENPKLNPVFHLLSECCGLKQPFYIPWILWVWNLVRTWWEFQLVSAECFLGPSWEDSTERMELSGGIFICMSYSWCWLLCRPSADYGVEFSAHLSCNTYIWSLLVVNLHGLVWAFWQYGIWVPSAGS